MWLLISIGALSGCSEVELTDVSKTPAAKALICEQYEIVGDVDAYGIRKHSKAEVDYVTLIPPPGIAGYEVGFRIPLHRGSIVTITNVLRTNYWFDSQTAFFVALEGTSLPVKSTIRIELFRGNEGPYPLTLNPDIYRKISPRSRAKHGGRIVRPGDVVCGGATANG